MRNPFVGLRPFDPTENDIFFGRAREIAVLQNLVLTLPVLVVYAPSGTGKSSLINAGLIPLLGQDDDLLPVNISDPQEDVPRAVREATISKGWRADADVSELALADLLERHFLATKRRVILVLDQFEERLKQGKHLDSLYEQIARLANSRSDAATVVISIREDFLAGLERLLRRVTGLLDASYRVPALSRSALIEAVQGPLNAVNSGVTTQSGLIEEVLNDLERQPESPDPGDGRIEAGYFQIVWSWLWDRDAKKRGDRLTRATYRNEGRVDHIVESFVARTLSELLPFEAEVLHAMTRYLVLPTGRKVPLTVEDLTGLIRTEDFMPIARELVLFDKGHTLKQLIGAVFEQLTTSEAPLFRRAVRGSREEFELVHDLLGDILLNWRLQFESDQASSSERVRVEAAKVASEVVFADFPKDSEGAETWLQSIIQSTTEFLQNYLVDLTARREVIYSEQAWQKLRTIAAVFGPEFTYKFGPKVLRSRFMHGRTIEHALDDILRNLEQVFSELRSAALGVPSAANRRILQRQAWDLATVLRGRRSYPSFTSLRGTSFKSPWLARAQTAVQIAVIFALVLGSMAGINWIISHLLPLPPIQYGPLTLSFAIILFTFIYCAGYSEGEEGQGERDTHWIERAAVLNCLWPRAEASWMTMLFIPIWWPFILFVFQLISYAGAAIFRAADWSPTAGFNAAALISGIGLSIWYLVVATD